MSGGVGNLRFGQVQLIILIGAPVAPVPRVSWSQSGYYEWRHRPDSVTQRRRELLADKIAALFRPY